MFRINRFHVQKDTLDDIESIDNGVILFCNWKYSKECSIYDLSNYTVHYLSSMKYNKYHDEWV